MEIEVDIQEREVVLTVAMIIVGFLALFGLSRLGKTYTPYNGNTARVLRYADWTLVKAEKAYTDEIKVLRDDVQQLAYLLDQTPNPVQVQLQTDQIVRDASGGVSSLAIAREAVIEAALAVRQWSTGALVREDAIASVELAVSLLR